jgi:hypothetical protein
VTDHDQFEQHVSVNPMDFLQVGDQLSSIGSFLLAVIVASFAVVNFLRQRSRRAERSTTVRLIWALRHAFTFGLVAVGLWWTIGYDVDFMFLFLNYLAWLNLGDLVGRNVSAWAAGPAPRNGLDRYRQADSISRLVWLLSACVLALSLLIFVLSDFAVLTVFTATFVILFSWACALIGYLPHQFEIRSHIQDSANPDA